MIPKYKFYYFKLNQIYDVINIDFYNEQVDCFLGKQYGDVITWDLNTGILIESTKLKDKKQQELYDGDVVLMKWTIYDEPEPYVIFKSYTGEWRVDNGHSGRVLGFSLDDVEKVGNVFSGDYEKLKQEWEDRQEQMSHYYR